jgi:hypothetical protein
MTSTLDIRTITDPEDRHVAVRDFLGPRQIGKFTAGALDLVNGQRVEGNQPRLIWLIEPLEDAEGNYHEDLAIIGIDLAAGLGCVRLCDLEGVEVEV